MMTTLSMYCVFPTGLLSAAPLPCGFCDITAAANSLFTVVHCSQVNRCLCFTARSEIWYNGSRVQEMCSFPDHMEHRGDKVSAIPWHIVHFDDLSLLLASPRELCEAPKMFWVLATMKGKSSSTAAMVRSPVSWPFTLYVE